MRVVAPLVALAYLCAPALAQDADKTQPHAADRDAPILNKFDLKTTDSGTKVQQRLELDISKDKDLFLFGNKTTAYPTARNPGQEFQPAIPQASPKDTYSIGIGKRF